MSFTLFSHTWGALHSPLIGVQTILLVICMPVGLLQSQVADPTELEFNGRLDAPNEFPSHYPLWKEMMEKVHLGYAAPATAGAAATRDSDGDGKSDLQEAYGFTDPTRPERELTVEESIAQRGREAELAHAASVSRGAQQAAARAFAAPWLAQLVQALEPGKELSPDGLRKEKRRRLAEHLPAMIVESEAKMREAEAAARRLGWPFKFSSPGGGGGVLKGTVVNGIPEYITTQNIQAARTILVDKLWPVLPAVPPLPPDPLNLQLNLEGGFLRNPGTSVEEIIPAVRIGLWEPGRPVTTHTAFGRLSSGATTISNSRVTDKEAAQDLQPIPSNVEHATHVSGTLAGRGLDYQTNSVLDPESPTRGMAPFAEVHSRDTLNDYVEMAGIFTDEPEHNRFFVSNHSYATSPGWTDNFRVGPYPTAFPPTGNFPIWSTDVILSGGEEDYRFGFYSTNEQTVDKLVYASETYLPVWAAGNERLVMDQGPPPNYYHWELDSGTLPDAGLRPQDYDFSNGYDTLVPEATAKNVLTVTSVPDRAGGISNPEQVESSYFASWGPPDYGHIKPDVAANGENLLSAMPDGSYEDKFGTSMAAPNVAGLAALLIELLQRNYGTTYEPSAAMLKALIIAGTDDIAPVGPDYKTGWGLVNARKSAEIVALNAASGGQHIRMVQVQNGVTGSFTVKAMGGVPLIATAVWLDVPGYVEAPHKDPLGKRATVDPALSVLKNDIDVKVTRSGNIWHPPSLRPDSDVAWVWTSPPTYSGPNRRDTVEKIIIPQPIAPTGSPLKAMPIASQVYTITYSAAVTLRNDLGQAAPQPLAIILSGIQPEGTPDFRILWFEETGDNEVTLLWPSVPGTTYWVQYSNTLANSAWTDIAGSNVIATTSYVARSVPKNTSGSQRFYRIRRVL